MRWILDDRPLDLLSGLTKPEALDGYPRGRLLIASTTAASAVSSPLRRRLVEQERPDGGRLIEVVGVLLGAEDPAEEVLFALHGQERETKNLAEREAIAWALIHGEDAVFVTVDRRAALTALAELGRSRVAHPFDLWLDLLEEGALDRDDFERLCDQTKGVDQGLERMPGRVARRFDEG